MLVVIGYRAARQVGTEVQLAVYDLRDDEADRGEQGHDEHVPEVAERYGQAEGRPTTMPIAVVRVMSSHIQNLTRALLDPRRRPVPADPA